MLRVFLKKHDFDPDMLIRVMLIEKTRVLDITYSDKFWRGENLAQNGKNRALSPRQILIFFSLRQIKSVAKKRFC